METELGERSPDIFTFPPPPPLPLFWLKKKSQNEEKPAGQAAKSQGPLAQGLDITGNDKISSAIWCK